MPSLTPEQATSEHVSRYRSEFLTSKKYLPEKQRHLKTRVFETFDALIKHRGGEGMVAGKSLLDLGSADGAFVTVCAERGLNARGLDISDGVNFEHDPFPVDSASI